LTRSGRIGTCQHARNQVFGTYWHLPDKKWSGGRRGYFEFYTDPPLFVEMPNTGPEDYQHSYYRQVQDLIMAGGFNLFDLG